MNLQGGRALAAESGFPKAQTVNQCGWSHVRAGEREKRGKFWEKKTLSSLWKGLDLPTGAEGKLWKALSVRGMSGRDPVGFWFFLSAWLAPFPLTACLNIAYPWRLLCPLSLKLWTLLILSNCSSHTSGPLEPAWPFLFPGHFSPSQIKCSSWFATVTIRQSPLGI